MHASSSFFMEPFLLKQKTAAAGVAAEPLPKGSVCLQVFEQFLAGDTLEECYAAVASVADRWLDLLDTQVLSNPGHSSDNAPHPAVYSIRPACLRSQLLVAAE